MPNAHDRLQMQAQAEQMAEGKGFFGRGTTAAQQAQENEEIRQSGGGSFATPPPIGPARAPRNASGGYNVGQVAPGLGKSYDGRSRCHQQRQPSMGQHDWPVAK